MQQLEEEIEVGEEEPPIIPLSSISCNYSIMSEKEVQQEMSKPHKDKAWVSTNEQGFGDTVSLKENIAHDSTFLPKFESFSFETLEDHPTITILEVENF